MQQVWYINAMALIQSKWQNIRFTLGIPYQVPREAASQWLSQWLAYRYWPIELDLRSCMLKLQCWSRQNYMWVWGKVWNCNDKHVCTIAMLTITLKSAMHRLLEQFALSDEVVAMLTSQRPSSCPTQLLATAEVDPPWVSFSWSSHWHVCGASRLPNPRSFAPPRVHSAPCAPTDTSLPRHLPRQELAALC